MEQCIQETPLERNEAKDVIETLVKQAMQGVVKWDRNVTRSINQGIQQLDAAISRQLAEVMHHEKFRALEGTWRGLQTLVFGTNTGKDIKIKVLNCSKRELFKDLSNAVEFDQSHLFKHIYTAEFDMPGGQPYGIMVGDYEFSNHPEDVELLEKISGVAAGRVLPLHLRGVAGTVRLQELGGLAQGAGPGRHLRIGEVRQVALLPGDGRLAFRRAHHAAGPGPLALWRVDQEGRRVPLRGGCRRAQRRADQGPGGPVLLDELVLCLRAP